MGEGILRKLLLASVWALALAAPVHADETVTFTYDEHGRLVRAARAGTVNNGVATDYQYDKADNRTRRALTGSSGTNPNAPTFGVNDASAAEGSSVVFTVTRAGPTTGAYNVTYTTANGSAAAGGDYTTATGTLAFASGETSKTVSVSTASDTLSEGNETFFLNLTGASGGAGFTDNQGVGTISDVPFFSINDASASEGSTFGFTVTRNGSTVGAYSVNFTTANNTAVAGSDYTSASGTLNFAAGEASKPVNVSVLTDAVVEGSETFFVNLSGATGNAQISDSQGVGTILPPPSFSVSDDSEDEGQSIIFVITKTGAATASFSVNFATANGTAVSPSDYGALSGTATFAPGETTKQYSTSLPYGSNSEPFTEVFYFNLSSPTGGATISDSQGVGSITNVPVCGGVPC
jgi:YD repeat-containing protein